MSVPEILAAVYVPLSEEDKTLFLVRLARAVTVSLRGYHLLPSPVENYPVSKSAALNELLYEVTTQLESRIVHPAQTSKTPVRSDREFLETITVPMIDCRAAGSLMVVFYAAARTFPIPSEALEALQQAIDNSYGLSIDPRLDAAVS